MEDYRPERGRGQDHGQAKRGENGAPGIAPQRSMFRLRFRLGIRLNRFVPVNLKTGADESLAICRGFRLSGLAHCGKLD